jgi:hypothetical protein
LEITKPVVIGFSFKKQSFLVSWNTRVCQCKLKLAVNGAINFVGPEEFKSYTSQQNILLTDCSIGKFCGRFNIQVKGKCGGLDLSCLLESFGSRVQFVHTVPLLMTILSSTFFCKYFDTWLAQNCTRSFFAYNIVPPPPPALRLCLVNLIRILSHQFFPPSFLRAIISNLWLDAGVAATQKYYPGHSSVKNTQCAPPFSLK